ncbi:lipopolysaccharide biosynthesis protein [Ramlibacter sp. Leaf400]|uniref:lipopolysaccharide biosynthesis protein n=1 Tax=Ramlibacter sp. Leaf400 TaxID=1736365 RepID=UPI0006F48B09|nr:lipopolysaccharide biosynthesis protein [Ramlibacter sp. Leaf400]KQT13546.1 polysaccharide biosynthesis protein [Ramlibacter sp. Leaf400]
MRATKLRTLAERAFKWSALTTIGRFALQLVAQVVLARLLGPSNYGVYGIGLVVLTFAGFLAGNAFSYSLVLKKEVDDDDVRFAFTWQLMAGLVCAAGVYASAGWLATYFGDPRVEPMLRWISVAVLLQSLIAPSSCLMTRELNFRDIGLIHLGSYGAGYLMVGVPLALRGFEAQALAGACVVQALVALVASFALRPHPIKPLLRHPMSADTFDTGRTVFFTNMVNWLLTNVDRIVIGRLLNTHSVGLYNVAYNFASIPYVLLVNSLQPTFLAAGARLQDDLRQLGQAWLTLLACMMVFLIPAGVLLSMLAGDLVRVLYGPAWSEAGWVMAIMFLCLPAWCCLGMSTPVLWNTGRKHLEAMLQLPMLAAAVPLWWLLAPLGIRAIVIAAAGVIFARAIVIVAAGLRALDLSWRLLLPFALRGLALAAVCGVAVTLGRQFVSSLHQPLATLIVEGCTGFGTLLLVTLVWPQVLGPEARGVLSRLIPSMGPRWAPQARP